MPALDPAAVLIVSLGLALLWLAAAWQKLQAFAVFVETLADYRLLSRSIVQPAGVLIVILELMAGMGLLVPTARSAALVGSAALILMYAIAMSANLLRGRRHIDCGCMGPAARQSLSGWLVLRNLVLAAAAVLAISDGVRTLNWIDGMTVLGGVAALAFSYASVNHLIANAPGLALLRR